MNILKRALFFSLISISFLWAGSSGKIAGSITDAESGEPLPGVNIVIKDALLGAASDLDGYYVILNVPPGKYILEVSMVGYGTKKIVDVVVRIDQTTTINAKLSPETLDIAEEITVVATRPVVEMDVAGSRANISSDEIKALPVTEVSSVVGLQAGIEGNSIRGGGADQVAYIVNGINMRDGRTNTSFSGISLISVDEIQVQAGGFSAEYGEARSGVVKVVTKEGSRNEYSFAMQSQYSPVGPKHFGHSPNSPNSYWIRPLVDDAVCWTGTKNGTWDEYTQAQYRSFDGWNEIARQTLENDDPNDDLTPAAAKQLALFQHRRLLDIQIPDYTIDMGFGGPVPFISKKMGGLRFYTTYKQSQSAYIIPLHDNAHRNYTWQFKLTSDFSEGKKLMFDAMLGDQTGVDQWNNGNPGMFTSSWQIASALSNGPKYIDGRMFGTDYWTPARTEYSSFGLKWTHPLTATSLYEVILHRFSSKYHKSPGRARDNTLAYKFGDNYWVDEAPFGFESDTSPSIDGMRMGVGMSNARDSSEVAVYSGRVDLTSQIGKKNNIKAGVEFNITDSRVNYATYDAFLTSKNRQIKWDKMPIRAGAYIQDKLEFEGMVATIGLRMDYSHAGGDWYKYDDYTNAFSSAQIAGIDTLLKKEPTAHIFKFSPRLAIAFPVTASSKIYFNYGHFYQLPQPDDLFMFALASTGGVTKIGNPNADFQKTIAYEIGYDHSLFEDYLLRVAGYYKDVSNQTRDAGGNPLPVLYENFDGSVSYSRIEPNNYYDIRGFEFTVNKNRGSWVRGFFNYTYMVTTRGYFGYGKYFENKAAQREYERNTSFNVQRKPKPRPYARANIDFFTPDKYGPQLMDIYPLEGLRLNLNASWKTGLYDTWTGGSSISGIYANVQWKDYYNLNLRFNKSFRLFDFANVDLFVNISNVFNAKRLTSYGFVDGKDKLAYFKSLHLSKNTQGIEQFGYTNIPGNDQPGDYRSYGTKFVPIVIVNNYDDLITRAGNEDYLYYTKDTKEHYWYSAENGTWSKNASRTQKVYDNKAYIDMPNLQYLAFLSNRDVFWGIKLSFNL